MDIPDGYQVKGNATDAPEGVQPVQTHHNGFVSFFRAVGKLFTKGVPAALKIVQKDAPALEGVALTVGTLAGVGPEVAAGEETFNAIFKSVLGVEQVAQAVGAGDGTGTQKLAAAVPQIEQIILQNPMFKGLQVADVDKYTKAVAQLTSAVVDIGNSFAAPAAK